MVKRGVHGLRGRGGRGGLLEKEDAAKDGADRHVEPALRPSELNMWFIVRRLQPRTRVHRALSGGRPTL